MMIFIKVKKKSANPRRSLDLEKIEFSTFVPNVLFIEVGLSA